MKRLVLRLTLIIPLIFICICRSYGQMSSREIDSLVNAAKQEFNIPGVAIGVVKDGEIIHAKGYGVTSLKSKKPVNKHTNFAIASLSKAFTTTALAILVEEGKIGWNDKVSTYIPEFKMYNPYVTAHFTVDDLLTHRSGLDLGAGDLMIFPGGSDFTMDDILHKLQYLEPVSEFRTKFDYNNLLYLTAGELIKRVTGKSWAEFISQKIFRPLQMDRSYGHFKAMDETGNVSDPHSAPDPDGNLQVIPHYYGMPNGAAGGIYSNIDDLCRWMKTHLNEGRYGDDLEKRLFTEASQDEMWSVHTTLTPWYFDRYNSHFRGYGLGWFVSDIKGRMHVQHSGAVPGMISNLLLIPDIDLGIIVLTNHFQNGGSFCNAVALSIMDAYLGLDDHNWIDRIAKPTRLNQSNADSVVQRVWNTVDTSSSKHIDESNYTGIYADDWFGEVEVFEQDEQLRMKCHRSPKLTGTMHFYNANTFVVEWDYDALNADVFAMFELNEDGKAVAIKMKGVSPNLDFSFDFGHLDLKRKDG